MGTFGINNEFVFDLFNTFVVSSDSNMSIEMVIYILRVQVYTVIEYVLEDYSNNVFKLWSNSKTEEWAIFIGLIFILTGIFIKLSVAPFHLWSLDVYEGSYNKVTAFFAIFPKICFFVLLTRLCYTSFYEIFIFRLQFVFLTFSVLSVLIGSFGGLEQRKIKTLLAYSSISHTGLLLLSFSSASAEGLHMTFFYLSIYMISGICFWSIYLLLDVKRSNYINKFNKELGDFNSLSKSNAFMSAFLAVALFSIAGIPPLVGFLAKFSIFLASINASIYFISLFNAILSVVSTFYYIRFIKVLYFENSVTGVLYKPIKTNIVFITVIFSLLLIILFFSPSNLFLFFAKSVLLFS